ncbi:MAG: RodZ domain-containing protein [Actinomycetota bacterium]
MIVKRTGIGEALRKARVRRGKSLMEASRDTRVRPEYLRALEAETFDQMGEAVYVRGFLRTYASYLGLDAEKVVGAYERAFGPAPAVGMPANGSLAVGADRERRVGPRHISSGMLAGAVAIVLLVAIAAIGWFSRASTAPEAASVEPPSGVEVLPQTVQVDLVCREDVSATVLVDGREVFDGTLRAGEARSFVGDREIQIEFGVGGRVRLVVNDRRLGTPGVENEPFAARFTPASYRSG